MSEQSEGGPKPPRALNEKKVIKIALEQMKKAAPEIDRHVRERNAISARARFIPPRAPNAVTKKRSN